VSIIDFIEKLQKKPRGTRVRIMWLTVTFCMIVIFFGWLWSLTALNSQISSQTEQAQSNSNDWQQVSQDMPSLWSSLTAGIGNVFSSIKDGLQSQSSQESASSSPSESYPAGSSSFAPSPSVSGAPESLPNE
jgi:predicted PurR-regulated permease PerM